MSGKSGLWLLYTAEVHRLFGRTSEIFHAVVRAGISVDYVGDELTLPEYG